MGEAARDTSVGRHSWRRIWMKVVCVLVVAVGVMAVEAPASFAGGGWTVDTAGSGTGPHDGKCDVSAGGTGSIHCTLEEALSEASYIPGPTHITFAISGPPAVVSGLLEGPAFP